MEPLLVKLCMTAKKIIVIGSFNMDMVVKADHIPVPGETVMSGSFFMNPGGKGANQAVSVARLGGDVVFIAKVGKDIFGEQSFSIVRNEGIDISNILSDHTFPTGVALITVDRHGENCITVASGANANLSICDVEPLLQNVSNAGIILMQLEIPMDTVHFVADYAYSRGIKCILNPAPAGSLAPDLLSKVSILTPNITEAEKISGIKVSNLKSAEKAAMTIYEKGVENVIVTLGDLGALIIEKGKYSYVKGNKVKAVDTTAAGDVFNGALAVSLAEGKNLTDAVRFACHAASVSVTKFGAQSSIPFRNELINNRHKS